MVTKGENYVWKKTNEERISRVISRDRITAGEIKKRMNTQLSDIERIEMADFVIDNSATEKKLVENVKGIIGKLLKA